MPQLVAVSSAVGFGSLDLSIHSYSADWLYQALLYIFSGVIQRQIEEAVNNAMHTVRIAQSCRLDAAQPGSSRLQHPVQQSTSGSGWHTDVCVPLQSSAPAMCLGQAAPLDMACCVAAV